MALSRDIVYCSTALPCCRLSSLACQAALTHVVTFSKPIMGHLTLLSRCQTRSNVLKIKSADTNLSCVLQWDALDEAEKAKFPFQRDLKRRMDGIMADCMKKIERNKERLAAADTPLITPADQVFCTAES